MLCAAAAILCALDASPARAQAPWPGRLDISVGAVWTGGFSLGETSATLTPNQAGSRITLFDTETDLEGTGNIELRMSYAVASDWAAEMGVSYGRPAVRTTITNDFEGGTPTAQIASERLHEYVFEATALYQPDRWLLRGGRGRIFLSAGAGYLRDLHEERTLIENGTRVHLGGGVKYLVAAGPRRAFRGFGVRADARLYLRDGGVQLDDQGLRRSGAVSAAALLVF
jgi:hypothetical protein